MMRCTTLHYIERCYTANVVRRYAMLKDITLHCKTLGHIVRLLNHTNLCLCPVTKNVFFFRWYEGHSKFEVLMLLVMLKRKRKEKFIFLPEILVSSQVQYSTREDVEV